jgi:hypothetical protein
VLEKDGKYSIMITWTKRLLLTCTILGLLATNVLTLTSAAFNTALSGITSTAPGSRNLCMAKYQFINDIRRLAIAAFTDGYYPRTA